MRKSKEEERWKNLLYYKTPLTNDEMDEIMPLMIVMALLIILILGAVYMFYN